MAVIEASLAAGARDVQLIEEPMAGRDRRRARHLGARRQHGRGRGRRHHGGGRDSRSGGIVRFRLGAHRRYELDEAIAAHIRRRHRMAIGAQTAEDLKFEIGSAGPLETRA